MQQAIYDISKTYLYNMMHGPFFKGPMPNVPKGANTSIFGHTLNNPLGVPAGPLLNSKWIELASNIGFSYLTYKTIRSTYYPSHPLPNVAFVNWSDEETLSTTPASALKNMSITNSFGMPSMSLDFLSEDIQRSLQLVKEGQLLSVSITGTETQSTPLVKDLCYLVRFLVDLKVPVIEVNFSCPNVLKKGGELFLDEEAILSIGKELNAVAFGTPLVLKVGVYPSKEKLTSCLIAMDQAGFQGVCGINSVKKTVKNPQGSYALGASRPESGICGAGIFEEALKFTRQAKEAVKAHNLNLEIISTGGVVQANQFDQLLSAGAKITQSATGMMWDPLIATKYLSQAQLVGANHE